MRAVQRVLAGLLACACAAAWAQAPSTTELPPPPGQPIEVPRLPADAGKADLLEAYFRVTGDPMLDGLVDEVAAVPESARRRAEGCPQAIEFIEAAALEQFRPYLEQSVARLRGDLMALLGDALTETDLRAFLRFAATPDGQRHLNGAARGEGELRLAAYPAYERDEELRTYQDHLDLADARLDEALAGWQQRMMTDEDFAATLAMVHGRYEQFLAECGADGTAG